MASFTLGPDWRFHVGDTIYCWRQGGGLRPATPTAVTSATVAANSTTTFTGLNADAQYLAGKAVSGPFVTFQTDPADDVDPDLRATGLWVDTWRIANAGTPIFSNYAQTGARFTHVMMNVWERTHLAALKAANPDITVWAYQNAIYDRVLLNAANGFQPDCACGISREEVTAAAAVTDWYARNAGALVLNPTNGSDRLLRLDLPEVQAPWVANAIARAQSGTTDFDGIFADDYNVNVPTLTVPVTTDQGWWLRCLRPWVNAVYPSLRANGLMLLPNFGAAGAYTELADSFALMDGFCDEFWMRYAGGSWNGYWYHAMLMVERAVAQGTMAFLNTPGASNSDTTSLVSGLAAALLVTDATDPSLVVYGFSGVDYSTEKYDATYFGMDIGSPSGARAWTGTAYASCLIRYFTDGVVVLNPGYNPGGSVGGDGQQRTGSTVVSLTGGTYTGSGLTSVASVTLPAGSGAILNRD